MASEFLETLLRLNVAAAVAVLVVLFLRRGVRRLAGAKAAYALWIAVPVAMAAGLIPSRRLVIELPGVSQNFPAGADLAPLTPQLAADVPVDWWSIALVIWAVGALVGLAWLAWRHARFLAQVGCRTENGRVSALAEGIGPAVVGVLSPKILLPRDFEDRFTPREREVVLAHEEFHLNQKHAQTNALVLLGLCLNWFNPLLHVASRTLRLDQELACDEAVIARFPKARRSYAEAMIKTQFSPEPLSLGCYWPAKGSALRQRLSLLHAPSPTPARTVAGACLAGLLATLAGLGAWAATPAKLVYVATPSAPSSGAGVSLDAALEQQLADSRQSVVQEIGRAQQAYEAISTTVAAQPLKDEALRNVTAAREALVLFDDDIETFAPDYDTTQDQHWPVEPMIFEAAVTQSKDAAAGIVKRARQPPRDPAEIEKGARVWIDTAAILPNGREIGGQAMFNRPGSTKAQDGFYRGDPRYSMASSVVQQGERVQVRPKLMLDGDVVGTGSAWIESGKAAVIRLDNGQVVTARAAVTTGNGFLLGLSVNRAP